MSIKHYVDKFVAPMAAELDKAKYQMIEKLKSRLVEEMEVNEKTRNDQVKLEEQLKIEKEKNATLQAEKDDLTEMLATKEEIIKVLTNGADRINNNREKDATIRQLRQENDKLRQEQQQSHSSGTQIGTKRRRDESNETTAIKSRVLRPRKERCVIFGFGANNNGQLGINEDKLVEPVELKKFGAVDFVDACYDRSFSPYICSIDQNGDVYLNGVKQNGITTQASMVTSDWSWHYVIDAKGGLWSWGHGDTKKREMPKLIEALKGEQIKEVSASNSCIACITVDNSCFVWGNCERFGLHRQVTSSTKLNQSIKSIAIGICHALMIDTNDDVYAIGHNFEGELGLGDYDGRSSWTKVTNLAGRVIKVQCGYRCSALLTTSGVFTMGSKFGGPTPHLVYLANVADISLKWTHILALTTSGELYAWGENDSNQCGIGQGIGKPNRIRQLDEKYHIRQMSAGNGYSLIRCAPKSN